MQLKVSEQQLFIEILTGYGPTRDAWDEPINAIVKATGRATIDIRHHVEDLQIHGLVEPRSIVADGPIYNAWFEWKRSSDN